MTQCPSCHETDRHAPGCPDAPWTPCGEAWANAGHPDARVWWQAWEACEASFTASRSTIVTSPSPTAKRDAQIRAGMEASARANARFLDTFREQVTCAYCDEYPTDHEKDGPEVVPVCRTHKRRENNV